MDDDAAVRHEILLDELRGSVHHRRSSPAVKEAVWTQDTEEAEWTQATDTSISMVAQQECMDDCDEEVALQDIDDVDDDNNGGSGDQDLSIAEELVVSKSATHSATFELGSQHTSDDDESTPKKRRRQGCCCSWCSFAQLSYFFR
jgi:acyl-CoA hydrolase